MDWAVKLERLSFAYDGGKQVLRNLNLKIPYGSKTIILGSNGSGKTTLLQHLNGLIMPQQGTISILGESISKQSIKQIRQKVGYLFDVPDHQLISSTVFSDVAFGPRNMQLDEEQVTEKVKQVLNQLDIMELSEESPFNLSLGQKKKAAIAGLLAMEPQLIVCDEPFSGLDPETLGRFVEILDQANAQGTTIIASTHDVNLAYEWAKQVIVIADGELLAVGGNELLRDEELMLTAKLEMPILARLFQNMDEQPRTVQEASAWMQLNRYT